MKKKIKEGRKKNIYSLAKILAFVICSDPTNNVPSGNQRLGIVLTPTANACFLPSGDIRLISLNLKDSFSLANARTKSITGPHVQAGWVNNNGI